MPRDIDKFLKKNKFFKKTLDKKKKKKPRRGRIPLKRGPYRSRINKRMIIREGAKRKRQIIITYVKTTTKERKTYRIAPYSYKYRRLKVGRRKMLYGYDFKDRHIKGFALRNIKKTELTDKYFKPKWRIEIK